MRINGARMRELVVEALRAGDSCGLEVNERIEKNHRIGLGPGVYVILRMLELEGVATSYEEERHPLERRGTRARRMYHLVDDKGPPS